jgi:uncharacterized protein YjbI with pentapeptide repeats
MSHKKSCYWTILSRVLAVSIASALIVFSAVFVLKQQKWAEWTGFGEDKIITQEEKVESNKVQTVNGERRIVTKIITQAKSGKTLWDWLELALVPALLLLLSYQLQQIEKDRADQHEQLASDAAAANLRNEAQQAYFDRMAKLLLDKELKNELFSKRQANSTEIDNSVLDVARILTVTILKRLEGDKELTDEVLYFLREVELLEFVLENAILKNIKLVKPDLYRASLNRANLENIDLKGATLILADLEKAILKNAQLESVTLTEANLMGAHLEGANLKNANLEDANLKKASLVGAKLEEASLAGADLEGANLKETDLENAHLEETKNLTIEQVKAATNWEKAYYDDRFKNALGL